MPACEEPYCALGKFICGQAKTLSANFEILCYTKSLSHANKGGKSPGFDKAANAKRISFCGCQNIAVISSRTFSA
jgi:hypothetical protein